MYLWGSSLVFLINTPHSSYNYEERMAGTRSKRGNPIPLIVEPHPDDYEGYPFITLLQYRKEHILTLIDNADAKTIKAYVLDMCGPANVNEELLISVAKVWYDQNGLYKYPVSFTLSQYGLSGEASKIYRSFNIEHITRVIGPLPKFEMKEVQSVKRRRKKAVPPGVEVKNKVIKIR